MSQEFDVCVLEGVVRGRTREKGQGLGGQPTFLEKQDSGSSEEMGAGKAEGAGGGSGP